MTADGTPSVKRYRFSRCKLHFDPHICMCGKLADANGDYVLYEDHAAALSAAEERERKLQTALREARGFIAVVEAEEGLTIDNLIEMIDSALKHGNEALEAR